MTYLKIFRAIIFVFIWVFCLLFTMEIILRGLGYFHSRKASLAGLTDNRVFNILCIGDSFTYGWGVDTRDSYPRQLEERLNNSDLGVIFKVFNLGVPGSNSSQHLMYLEDILERYKKPDLVILLTGTNDSWNLADSNIYRFIKNKTARDSANMRFRIFFSELRVYKMLKMILLNLKGETPESNTDLFKQSARYENIDEDVFRQLTEYNLAQIVKLAESNNVKLILHDYPRGDPFEHDITYEVALRFNVPFVKNSSIFKEELKKSNPKDLFIYDNSHPNRRGYSLMVEELYKIISGMIKD